MDGFWIHESEIGRYAVKESKLNFIVLDLSCQVRWGM